MIQLKSVLTVVLLLPMAALAHADQDNAELRHQVVAAMKKAATFYRQRVASHGGYVYHYSLDLQQRWGEGVATIDQVWVQPPGTPTVGLAYLNAYHVTGDEYYLEAATAAAEALVYGQLRSGGWTNCIDFDPHGSRSADYRNGTGRGKNNSSLDDGQTQSAIRLMIHVDQAHGLKHPAIHESASVALDALLQAQFANGAFPQVWTGPVGKQPIMKARYPNYDWRTEGRVKDYWNMYTLNDNVCGYVAETLIDAYQLDGDERYLASLRQLGNFLLLAQMPDPQPAWAQQYNYEMKPIWARQFEPPAIAGEESQQVIATLLRISEVTGDDRYLEPIPPALAYLRRSLLNDGRLARYYELQTNRPLYMARQGKRYTLTYDDSNLPTHYAWKSSARLSELEAEYLALRHGQRDAFTVPLAAAAVRRIIANLDDQGRWISTYRGERLVGQAKMTPGTKYLSSQRFSQNLRALSTFLRESSTARFKVERH